MKPDTDMIYICILDWNSSLTRHTQRDHGGGGGGDQDATVLLVWRHGQHSLQNGNQWRGNNGWLVVQMGKVTFKTVITCISCKI